VTELLRGLCNQLPILPVLCWGWWRPDIRVPWAFFSQRVWEINWFVHLETLQGVYNAFHLLIFLCQFLPNLGRGQRWIESFRIRILYQHNITKYIKKLIQKTFPYVHIKSMHTYPLIFVSSQHLKWKWQSEQHICTRSRLSKTSP